MNRETTVDVLPPRDAIAGFSPMSTAEAVDPPGATPSPTVRRTDRTHALRCREYRRRRAEGLTLSAPLEIRATEIETMVRLGILDDTSRTDRGEIAGALYAVLDAAFAAIEAGELRVELAAPPCST